MSYYSDLVANDIIGLMREELTRGNFKLRNGDAKLVAEKGPTHNTPWHHTKHSYAIDCFSWNSIMFEVVFKQRFVPSKCQECYKVVARPKTLLGLFALVEIQKLMDVPAKAGYEVRPDVFGAYGGYWYCHGLEEGRERYAQVRAAVDASEHLGPEVEVLLKRACTEYERALGPSDQWEVTEEQLHLERLVERYVVLDTQHQEQSEHAIANVHRRWIEWAYAAGDETYKHFTGGKPLYEPYVTYHEPPAPAAKKEKKK